MSDTSQNIQRQFNEHMFKAVNDLGLSIHHTSVSVMDRDGFYDVRYRASHETLAKLDAAAKEFANSYTPPLNIHFV